MVFNIRSLSLTILISIVLYNEISPSEAIVKGENARPGEFPSIVSLRNETGGHYCAGTLVTRKHIVTLASCLYDDLAVFFNNGTVMRKPEDIKVLIGTLSLNQGGDIYDVEKFIQHPEYAVDAVDSWINDVAVIVLKEEVDSDIKDVVPTLISLTPPKDDASGNAAGWGTLSYNNKLDPINQNDFPTALQKLPVNIQDIVTCARKYEDDEDYYVSAELIKSKYLLCGQPIVDGAGMCLRDNGSPLIVHGDFVGFLVGGVPCGRGFPDLYVSTAAHQDFIKGAIDA